MKQSPRRRRVGRRDATVELASRILARLGPAVTADAAACWVWPGAVNSNGYGHVRSRPLGGVFYVHRLMLAWRTGEPGVGLDASHANECVGRRCCNPDHLSWKTHRDNLEDVIRKHGRLFAAPLRESRAPLPLLGLLEAPGDDRGIGGC